MKTLAVIPARGGSKGSNMAPGDPRLRPLDRDGGDAKDPRQEPDRGRAVADDHDLLRGELGEVLVLPGPEMGHQAEPIGVTHVVQVGAVLQVVSPVVRVVPVKVVDLLTLRTRPDEGRRNEAMDFPLEILSLVPKRDVEPTAPAPAWLQDMADPGGLAWPATAHTPKAGHLVPADCIHDRSPLFFHATSVT